MNVPKEVLVRPIDELKRLIDNRAASEFMGVFPSAIEQSYLDPILKQEELAWDDLDTLQDFSENILNYSLENTIVLLSCVARGGDDSTYKENGEPRPYYGVDRDHAIHDLALQGQAIRSMFNSLAFHLILKFKRKLEAEGKGGAE